MAELKWDATGERTYETGVKECVLYVQSSSGPNGYANGVAWNGVTAITESPSGAEPTALYADDIKYLNLLSIEEFAATIEAYNRPDAFAVCDGDDSALSGSGIHLGQQERKKFALCYKTTKGNDEDGNNHGYLIHIIYGCMAAPSEKAYETINDSPDAITFSWELSTTPIEVGTINGVTYDPTATVTLDSTILGENTYWETLLGYLRGDSTRSAQVLTPAQIYKILTTGSPS